jgi:putative addiction module component (TIGR02574 family)
VVSVENLPHYPEPAMPVSLEALGIDRMTIEERLQLVQAIWDSIPHSAARPPISDALRAELDWRLADHLANPADVVPWEEVKAAALARMKR